LPSTASDPGHLDQQEPDKSCATKTRQLDQPPTPAPVFHPRLGHSGRGLEVPTLASAGFGNEQSVHGLPCAALWMSTQIAGSTCAETIVDRIRSNNAID
jgi:hypothetical protein